MSEHPPVTEVERRAYWQGRLHEWLAETTSGTGECLDVLAMFAQRHDDCPYDPTELLKMARERIEA